MAQDAAARLAASVGAKVGAVETSISNVGTGARDLSVNKDNVLQAAKIIQDVLDSQGTTVRGLLESINVQAPGGDPVSMETAQAWQERLVTNPDSHAHRIADYLNSLQTLVGNLKTTALHYGYSEQDIADSFKGSGAAS